MAQLTPEIIARVDAWIEKRSTPVWLSRWRHLTSARGLALLSGRTEEAATAEAAMMGIMVALVQEAWGEPHAHPTRVTTAAGVGPIPWGESRAQMDESGDAWSVLGWGINRGRGRVMETLAGFNHRTIVDALVRALESAP